MDVESVERPALECAAQWRVTFEAGEGARTCFVPDSTRLLAWSGRGVFSMDLASGRVRRLDAASRALEAFGDASVDLCVAPDGSILLVGCPEVGEGLCVHLDPHDSSRAWRFAAAGWEPWFSPACHVFGRSLSMICGFGLMWLDLEKDAPPRWAPLPECWEFVRSSDLRFVYVPCEFWSTSHSPVFDCERGVFVRALPSGVLSASFLWNEATGELVRESTGYGDWDVILSKVVDGVVEDGARVELDASSSIVDEEDNFSSRILSPRDWMLLSRDDDTDDGILRRWDLETGRCVGRVRLGVIDECEDLVPSPDGRHVKVRLESGDVHVFDLGAPRAPGWVDALPREHALAIVEHMCEGASPPPGWGGCPLPLDAVRALDAWGAARTRGDSDPFDGVSWYDLDTRSSFTPSPGVEASPGPAALTRELSWAKGRAATHWSRDIRRRVTLEWCEGASEQPTLTRRGARMYLHVFAVDELQTYYCVDLCDPRIDPVVWCVDHDFGDEPWELEPFTEFVGGLEEPDAA